MSVRRGGRVGLDERVAALNDAVAACEGRVPDEVLAPARFALERAAERRSHGDGLVVVALAGGTGTGKSSLFNALAGEDLAVVDVRRPTTSVPTAWVVADPQEAGSLLDWLEVPASRRVDASGGDGPDGLVLLDLPDIDSVESSNRELAARLADRVDVLVWVVDPLKYAQQSLHDGYLARLVEHAEVMHVVLNQVDRLAPDEVADCVDDLRRLVGGRRGPQVLITSVKTGEGLDRLTGVIHRDVTEQRAVAERIAADVRTAATELSNELVAPEDEGTSRRDRRRTDDLLDPAGLTSVLAALAGVEGIAGQARDAYLVAARVATRSVILRLLAFVAGAAGVVTAMGRAAGRLLGTAKARTVDPPGPTVTTTEVKHALSDLAGQARRQLPWSWAERVHDITSQVADGLPTALKAAVAPVSHRPDQRRWWPAVALLVTAAELVVAIGAGWLLAARITARTTLPSVPVVMLDDDRSVPGLLIAVGLVCWLVLLAIRAVAIRVGAKRHRRAAIRAAHEAVGDAVDVTAIAPLRDELDTYTRVRDALAEAST